MTYSACKLVTASAVKMGELGIAVLSSKIGTVHLPGSEISAVKILYSINDRKDPCGQLAPIAIEWDPDESRWTLKHLSFKKLCGILTISRGKF